MPVILTRSLPKVEPRNRNSNNFETNERDCREILKKFPDECVDCVITSPPYFNLRDYQVKGQIGLEKTWQEYVDKLIAVFNEVKRVLKKDGTCFVNLGDSYGGESSKTLAGRGGFNDDKVGSFKKVIRATDNERMYGKSNVVRLKNQSGSKCLMLIPERFAISMVDNGWILRNKLVWIKPNAMPESVQDRWKKAHEYIFFFTKSKKYFFDLDAIRTPHKEVSIKRAKYEQGRSALGLNPSSIDKKYLKDKSAMYGMPARQVKLNPEGAIPPDYLIINNNCSGDDIVSEHYATYPTNLIVPLIKAGCPKGGIVLDCFAGSNTTGLVARYLNRNWISLELNPDYIKIATNRLKQELLF